MADRGERQTRKLPKYVSNACQQGRHNACTGRVSRTTAKPGEPPYVTCNCPDCNHPEIRGMTIKDV